MGQLGRAGYPNQLQRGSDRNANMKLPPDPLAKCKHLEAESIFPLFDGSCLFYRVKAEG